jgi:hypothetical protein
LLLDFLGVSWAIPAMEISRRAGRRIRFRFIRE